MPKPSGRKRARALLDEVVPLDDLLGAATTLRADHDLRGSEASQDDDDPTVLDMIADVGGEDSLPSFRDSAGDEVEGDAHVRCLEERRTSTSSSSATRARQDSTSVKRASALHSDPASLGELDSAVRQSSGSLGGTEMALLTRKDEELADMASFLVRTLQRVCTPASYLALVQCFATHGVRAVLMALKHTGAQGCFFQTLCATPVTSRTLRAAVLRLFAVLSPACEDRELLCCAPVVRLLVECLKDDDGDGGAPCAAEACDDAHDDAQRRAKETARPSKPHWSAVGATRKVSPTPRTPVKANPASPTAPARAGATAEPAGSVGWSDAKRLVDELAAQVPGAAETAESPTALSSSSSCALRLLTGLVLSQNEYRHPRHHGDVESVAHLFTSMGGMGLLCGCLKQGDAPGHVEALLPVLSLLEVLTVSTCSSRGDADSVLSRAAAAVLERLQRLAPLPPVVSPPSSSSSAALWASDGDALALTLVNACLRVLTNMTNVDATVLHSPSYRRHEQALGQWLSEFLTVATPTSGAAPGSALTSMETTTFALCCAVNLVKYEAKHLLSAEASFTSALVWPARMVVSGADTRLGDGVPTPLLAALATNMFRCYLSDTMEETVLSGYYALLLAVLSLVRDDPDDVLAIVAPLNLRVRVLTAVVEATRGSSHPHLATATETPMALVVVILQEFLLFQSTSGTLTREGLVEMAALTEQLVTANHIDVDTSARGDDE